MIKRKKGFTIVELLGVFILLGVIAVIITPSILNLREDAEKDAFEQSVNALIRAAQVYHANNDFINFPANGISPTDPNLELKNNDEFQSGVVKLINDEYFYAYNVSNGKYCVNGVRNDLSVEEGDCPDTPSRCFNFDEETGTIIDFYDEKVGCDIPNPIIPEEINDVPVTKIGDFAFGKGIYMCEKEVEIYDWEDLSVDYEWYEDYVVFDLPEQMEQAKIELNNKMISKYGNREWDYVYEECYITNYMPIGYETYDGTWDDGQKYHEVYIEYGDYIDKTTYPNRLTGVTLPKTIKTIGNGGFENNDLSYVNFDELENLEHIGEWTFANNKIKSVDLSEMSKLSKLDYSAFNKNHITSVNFENLDSLEYIENNTFSNNQLRSVEITDLENLEYIDTGAFANNSISSLTIDNLPKLYYLAGFNNNLITSFEFDHLKSLETIGSSCFYKNKLTHVSVANLPLLKIIQGAAFAENTNLSSVNIQNLPELLTIQYSVFYKDSALRTLEIKDAPKLSSIGGQTFCQTGLTSITFTNANNIEYLGYYLFNKTQLPSFDFSIFPNLVTIDYHVMSQTSNALKEITIDNPKLEYIGQYAFDYNYQLRTVNMGENPLLTTMALGVFKWSGVDNIVIPKNVTTLGDAAYYRTISKAQTVTILGDNPTRFNSRWSAIGMTGGASNCPKIPTDGSTNTVTCS